MSICGCGKTFGGEPIATPLMNAPEQGRPGERIVELPPIRESEEDYETAEKRIRELFRREIYLPLMRLLGGGSGALKNSREDLTDAIRTGRITFSKGIFTGRFNASISKELKRLGARWDRKTGTWQVSPSSLPREVRESIAASESRFQEKIAEIDRKLAQILPEEIAGRIKLADSFERVLWKTDGKFRQSVKRITVPPQLTPERRKRIAVEWENNLKLYIKDFTEKEIVKLRGEMKKTVFTGNRYESAVKTIQESYGVSANKAKFLARQETSLLMTKFKESRYEDSGVKEYRWGTVAGSKLHPVRAAHKKLEGKIFRWDNPPITTEPGQPVRRNNPGQDYNCRCYARPIVRFKA
jgi:SPP1 gp7 family putative phage head morphogenesis protein